MDGRLVRHGWPNMLFFTKLSRNRHLQLGARKAFRVSEGKIIRDWTVSGEIWTCFLICARSRIWFNCFFPPVSTYSCLCSVLVFLLSCRTSVWMFPGSRWEQNVPCTLKTSPWMLIPVLWSLAAVSGDSVCTDIFGSSVNLTCHDCKRWIKTFHVTSLWLYIGSNQWNGFFENLAYHHGLPYLNFSTLRHKKQNLVT